MAETETATGDVDCSRSKNSSLKKRKRNFLDPSESRKALLSNSERYWLCLRLSGESSVEDDDVASSRIESPVRYRPYAGKTYPDLFASAPKGHRRAPPIPAKHLCCDRYRFPEKTLDCVTLALSSFNEANQAQQGPEYDLVYYYSGCIRHLKPRIYHLNFVARAKKTAADKQPKNELFFAEVKYVLREDGKFSPCVSCCCILGHEDIKTGRGGCKLLCKTLDIVQHPKDGFTKHP